MNPQVYLTLYEGSHTKPDAETIVTEVPKRLKAILPGQDLRWLYLHRVWVRAPFRHNGRGSIILRHTLDVTDAMGASLVLRCAPFDNKRLTKPRVMLWYKRHGFTPLGNDDHPDILLRHTDILIRRAP